MKSLTALLLTGALLLGFGSENASAQNGNAFGPFQQGRFGASSPFGNGQRQQGPFGPGQAGSFGQSNNRGQGRQGQGRQGQGRQGQGRQGQGRQGGNFGNQQDYFVGSDAQQIRRQLQNSQNQGRRPRARIDYTVEDLNEMRNSSRQSPIASKKPPLRVQLRPSFTLQQTSASEWTTRANTQLQRALPATIARTHLSVSGGTATLEGTVKSDYERQLAAKILSFQPGISQIDNRLTIESDLAAPLLVPAQ